jgi:hypothetical protein
MGDFVPFFVLVTSFRCTLHFVKYHTDHSLTALLTRAGGFCSPSAHDKPPNMSGPSLVHLGQHRK